MSSSRTTTRTGDAFTAFDREMMARALRLARRGEGYVEPNPMVGCVVVRKGRIIGEAYHHRYGRPHAEVEALRSCTESPRGATVYVTLEPCRHFGKTPPCTDALIEAKVARVIAATRDPNRSVSGGGAAILRRAGIDVRFGLLEAEALELMAPFFTRVLLRRPYVIAKWAQSLDGKLATVTGDSKWISCEASRHEVHKLRARMDAIIVGSETVLKDDPLLTARGVKVKRVAARVVLDGRLRMPERGKLAMTAGETPTIVFTTPDRAGSAKARRLARRGVEVLPCPVKSERLDVLTVLGSLFARGMTNVLVEGGAALISGFLRADLVDEAWVFVAPKLIGGREAPAVLSDLPARRMSDARAPRSMSVRRLDGDLLYRLRLTSMPCA